MKTYKMWIKSGFYERFDASIMQYYPEQDKLQKDEVLLVEQAEYNLQHEMLEVALKALNKINDEELNSQRPGGGYSRSATISYEAIQKIKQMVKK